MEENTVLEEVSVDDTNVLANAGAGAGGEDSEDQELDNLDAGGGAGGDPDLNLGDNSENISSETNY